MTKRGYRWFILATSTLPPVAVGLAIVLLWNSAVSATDVAIFALMYVLTSLGVYAGYHRLLTHRSFKTTRPVRLALTTLGIMGGQGPPIPWVAQHRLHHQVADDVGDPHSPHLDPHGEELGVVRGLVHAHMGWLLRADLDSEPMRYAPDLVRERDMRVLSRHALPIFAAGLVIPAVAGLAITGSLAGAVTGFLWGGPVRVFCVLHSTYATNSIGHYFGRRRYATGDESRNVGWLAIPSLGEAWHHNHHAFPTAASFRVRWWEVDFVGNFIGLLERVGLAWDVNRVSPERERSRLLGARPRAAAAAPKALTSNSTGDPS
jgi:stearoyl-CoA desaturase (delta-9 desaturase)